MARRALNTSPGAFRHRFNIESLTRTTDAGGGSASSWSTFATMWGNITPLNGSENYQADQVQASYTHVVTVRYLAGVKPSMRILYGSRVFQIHSVANIGENSRYLKLLCEEERVG